MNAVTKFYIQLLSAMNNEEGQDLAEYGLVLLLVAIAAVVAVTAFGQQIAAVFTNITGQLGGI